MEKSGYIFPPNIRLKGKKILVVIPNHYPGFEPGKWSIAEGRPDLLYTVKVEQDSEHGQLKTNIENFLSDQKKIK